MERVPVSSSALRSVGYADGTLEVEFVTGTVYRYFDVPDWLHAQLMTASSHGQFFNAQIRDQFRYERLV
jgi:hypothetical protein